MYKRQVQSTAPLSASSVPLNPVSGSNPAQPRRPSDSVMLPGEARRPVMRRSVVAQEPPPVSWVPWALAGILVLGFILGGLYLYRAGVLGGPVRPDSAPAAVPADSLQADSALLDDADGGTEPGRFGDPSSGEAPISRPAAAQAAPERPPAPVSTDSGTLQFTPLPSGTALYIDSRVETRVGSGIRLPAGWHEIGISAPGFALYIDSVRIEPGRTVTLSPNLSASNSPTPPVGSAAELRQRALARLDCDNPSAANRFGQACYDSRPQPLGPLRVGVPAGVRGTPSPVILIVKVSRQGRTLAIRTRQRSSDDRFTAAVEAYAQSLQWTPAMREGQPVDGWTQAPFQPDIP